MLELNKLYLMDCMEGMKEFPDKYFDLAIVDPPYGIGAGDIKFKNGTSATEKPYFRDSDWDKKIPPPEYFTELERVSDNQIIWGGNYFLDDLYSTRCYIIWDKTIHGNSYADCELAWTSFDNVARIFPLNMVYVTKDGRIHPTQKPIQLYKWILRNYAKPDMKILDTHVGSASSIIAFLDYGCEWIGFEIDPDYHKAASKRIKIHQMQTKLF